MTFDLKLLALLAGALAVTQGLAWLLARGLGARLERPAVALGLLLPLLFLIPWLGGTRLIVPSDLLQPMIPDAPIPGSLHAVDRHELLNDPIFQFLPWELEVRHALRDGRLPLWSDLLEGGSSPWVNPQAGVLSPLALLARPFPIQHFLLAMLALKLLLAAEGTWLLARAVGVSRMGAALAAAGFALSGGMMAWALFPHTAALAWVPWLTLGVIRLFRRARPERLRRTVATAALLTAALLLSGHPETAAVGGLFAAVCGLSLRSRRRSLVRGLGAAAVAALLGFALAAPLIVPFVLHLPLSQRAQETLAQSLPAHFVSAWQPLTWFVPGYGKLFLAPANPRAFGLPYQEPFRGPFNWADAESGYAGLLAFAGSLIALAAARRRAWPFLGFALASLLLAAQFLPVAQLLFMVPALRAPAYSRFLLVGCLALSIAGALGFDHLFSRRLSLRHALRKTRLVPALALGAAAVISLIQEQSLPVVLLWVLLLAAAALGMFRRRLGLAGLALVLLLDLVPWAQGMLPAGQPALFYPPSRLLEAARRETAGGPWRTVGEDYALFPSLLPVYGLAEARPHNPLAPVPYLRTLKAAFGFEPTMLQYFPPFRGVGHPFLDFLNVRAILWASPNPVPPRFERIDDGRSLPFRLYRNPRAVPRWFVPSSVDVIRPEELERWVAALDDGRRVAVYEPVFSGPAGQPAPAVVTALAVRPGRITLEVRAAGPTLVATSLGWPEGWRCNLPVTVVNGAFVGIRVPAPSHGATSRIELRFVPPGLRSGGALAAVALIACALLLAWPVPRRRRRR